MTRAGQTNATLGYDVQDNVTSVTDARNHTTSSVFDDFGNERSVVSPDSGTTSSSYDAAGNLSCQTNAKNETVTISWDALNRPTQVSWPNAARNTVLVWDQNRIGTLSGIQEEEFERAFTYDSLGQVTAETITKSGASVSTAYTYSATTGDLVSMTYPSGNVIQFSRDENGQVRGCLLKIFPYNGT